MKNYDKIKKKIDYEENIPRCGSCIHLRKPDIKPNKQGVAVFIPMLCKRYDFPTKTSSLCKNWKSRFGETLQD